MEIELTIALIESIIRNGPQMFITLIKEAPDDPTPEQIRALKIDESEPFFKE